MARSYVHEARRRVGPKRARIGPIVERLAAEHPDAVIALRFRSELELLISVMLSAQTTDVTVNRVTERLFEKYRRPEDYLGVPLAELEADVRPTGTFRQKARNLRGAMQVLLEEYDGKVPTRIEELVRLPGVGRKTANLVLILGHSSGENICVDTHVHRIANRLAWVQTRTPEETERALYKAAPRRWWPVINLYLVTWGQNVCRPVYPRCGDCVVADDCPRIGVAHTGGRR